MREQLTKRVEELKAESAAGRKMLADIEEKAAELKHNILRISGAIQVLEEELAKCDDETSGKNIPGMQNTDGLPEEGSNAKVAAVG